VSAALRLRSRPLGSVRKTGLSLEVVLIYVQARWMLPRLELKEVLRRLRQPTRFVTPLPRGLTADEQGIKLGRAVVRTLALAPTDTRCLVRSVVLSALLARRSIPSTLVVGVKTDPHFRAHAWVEGESRDLLSREGYSTLVRI